MLMPGRGDRGYGGPGVLRLLVVTYWRAGTARAIARRVWLAAALSLVLGLVGCTGAGESGSGQREPTSAPTAGSPSEDRVLVDASGQPARPAPDGVITTSALGPLVVGMSAEEALATGLARWEESADVQPGFTYEDPFDVFIGGSLESGVTGFLVKGPGWATPEGIRAGSSTTADLAAAYGDRLEALEDDYGAEFFRVRDGDFGYFFQADPFSADDTVIAIVSGSWANVSRQLPNSGLVG